MQDRTSDELADLLTLCAVPGVGSVRFAALIDELGSPTEALAADMDRLVSVAGINARVAGLIATSERTDAVLRQCDRTLAENVAVLACTDPDYPPQLAELDDAPPLLFVKGSVDILAMPGVAVIGTRRPSSYGRRVTSKMVRGIVRHGVVVISGMARGVDSLAHHLALKASGHTVAVLGCGVDVVYPPEARSLRDRIAEEGALVSEFRMGTTPEAMNFPRRNRIISGLSRCVLVTEAPRKSGALITADAANNHGREVFAVPADITREQGEGSNRLIGQGAHVALTPEDVLTAIGIGVVVSTPEGEQMALPIEMPAGIPDEWRTIVNALDIEPQHVDVLAARIGRSTPQLLQNLMDMEMQDLVEQHPGTRFSRPLST